MSFEIGIGPNLRKSAFFDATVADGVKSFSVYNHMLIPGHFGDPDAEYERLINGVAMWDVAAQRQVEVSGPDAAKLIQYLTPRDLSALIVGKGRYVPLCDADGWLINDPVLMKLSDDKYWLSVADSDIHLWAAGIADGKGWDVKVCEPDVSPLAVQGPLAERVIAKLFGQHVTDLKYFGFVQENLDGIPLVLARSGWSKQGGFELYLQDAARGTELWNKVKAAGAEFGIGPGAPNDIERLESGLISYGADMRRQIRPANPFEMGMASLVDLQAGHAFVGRTALDRASLEAPKRQRVGVVIEGRPTPPGHPAGLFGAGNEIGFVSEFAYSPRLKKTIGVGLMQTEFVGGDIPLSIEFGEMTYAATQADIPFI